MINLQITYADGTAKEVTAGAPDIVAFESKFDLSIGRLEKDFRLTHLFFLAWNAEKRTKATDHDFDAWLETVELVEAAEQKK
jgi:hypothetical protein